MKVFTKEGCIVCSLVGIFLLLCLVSAVKTSNKIKERSVTPKEEVVTPKGEGRLEAAGMSKQQILTSSEYTIDNLVYGVYLGETFNTVRQRFDLKEYSSLNKYGLFLGERYYNEYDFFLGNKYCTKKIK